MASRTFAQRGSRAATQRGQSTQNATETPSFAKPINKPQSSSSSSRQSSATSETAQMETGAGRPAEPGGRGRGGGAGRGRMGNHTPPPWASVSGDTLGGGSSEKGDLRLEMRKAAEARLNQRASHGMRETA
ncbi:hypothetical protein SeMB42_g00236 [Synchytrium endobioticum]|uniref:Uncharacterized protein n=1 Tax=Synchytrium endobioticum TaxID=286115 RepID=A0A507CX97_9FUNG|nr:hypothetical protein SeLEV6574_g04843 [Synchytrium endobioticum]TPX54560.1 hypothetical protein SeMB42_g00236 [Synchytrium endobioticum]